MFIQRQKQTDTYKLNTRNMANDKLNLSLKEKRAVYLTLECTKIKPNECNENKTNKTNRS